MAFFFDCGCFLFSGHAASVDINHYPHGMHYLCELTSMKFGSDISFVSFLSNQVYHAAIGTQFDLKLCNLSLNGIDVPKEQVYKA